MIIEKAYAKINLFLDVCSLRADGFHNVKTLMQSVSLCDELHIDVTDSNTRNIELTVNGAELAADADNLVYRAALAYLDATDISAYVHITLEKNIPIAAGLAGGSTDAAGTIFGLNSLLEKFNDTQLNELCAQLGSDLNVCLNGGCTLATSRGEITKKLPNIDSAVTLIKPKKLGISAGEAYKKYSLKENKPQNDLTEKMLIAILDNDDIKPYLYNDLEYAVFDDYEKLQTIKTTYPQAIMSGSGSTYFVLENIKKSNLNDEYEFINNLKFIPDGVSLVD
jgi:4-diphosphocytidyl-2-C-methyl-D-erythritol kinase